MDRQWFAQKRFGYGAGLPIAWQGWAVYGAGALALGAAAVLLRGEAQLVTGAVVLAAVVVVAAVTTRGGWRWRWDDRAD